MKAFILPMILGLTGAMPQYQNFGASSYPTSAGYSLTIGKDGSLNPQRYYQQPNNPAPNAPQQYYTDSRIPPTQSSLSQFEQYNLDQQAKQQQLLQQLAIEQQQLFISGQSPSSLSSPVQLRAQPPIPQQPEVEPDQPVKPVFIQEDSLKAIEATGQASSGFVDDILEAFGDDISPENKQKAEEIKTTFSNLASKLSGFAARLQGIADKVPQLTQLLSLQQAASKKGISFEATKDSSTDKVLSFA